MRRIRIRTAEHRRSAETEHREILRLVLVAQDDRQSQRFKTADRLADFRQRTAERGSSSTTELLAESRGERLETLSRPR